MTAASRNFGGGIAVGADSSANLGNVIRGLKMFDGKDPAEFKNWMTKLCVVLGVTRRDILPLLKDERKPDPSDTEAFEAYKRSNEDLYAILFLLVELPAALSVHKHEDDSEISGDGQAAFKELCSNFGRVTDEVKDNSDGGFMFATCSPNRGWNFTASATGTAFMVDSGASETIFDDRLISRRHIRDYKESSMPKIIEVTGQGQLKGMATGILQCRIKDDNGHQLSVVRIQGIIVPGLGRNIFSSTSLLKKGLRFVVEEDTPHLIMHGAVVPLTQNPRDQGMYTLDVDFEENITPVTSVSNPPRKEAGPSAFGRRETTTLVNKPSAMCSLAVSADIWHRRLGHLNHRSMNILHRQKGTDVEYQDKPSPCDVCEIAKHKQTSHPKTTTRELSRPGQLVCIDNMGPIQPPARSKGGTFSYVCKFTDGYSRMKEVFLLRHKTKTTEALHPYNMQGRAFEGKLCGFGLDSQTYHVYNPSNGTVVESQNVTFIETPARTVPYQISDEDHGYESDVLSFTSLSWQQNVYRSTVSLQS